MKEVLKMSDSDKERLDYLLRYLEVLAQLPTNGPIDDVRWHVRKEIESYLGITVKG